SCVSVASYDATSYKNATDVKAEALLVMDHAVEPAPAHKDEIATLRLHMNQAFEYERGKGKPNGETVKMWEILVAEEHDLLGGFLADWERSGTKRPMLIAEKKLQVAAAFDTIIRLEQSKVKD